MSAQGTFTKTTMQIDGKTIAVLNAQDSSIRSDNQDDYHTSRKKKHQVIRLIIAPAPNQTRILRDNVNRTTVHIHH